MIRTDFRVSDNGDEHRRIAVERREATPAGVDRHQFNWNPATVAIRGFAVLCIRHFLAIRDRQKEFELKAANSPCAKPLADAVRHTKAEDKARWFFEIAGVGPYASETGSQDCFLSDHSNYRWVRFDADECFGAEFRFFLDNAEITHNAERLGALADAIEQVRPLVPPPAPEPPLSIRIYSRDDLRCLCIVRDEARLRERGLLPLPAAAEAQIHVVLPEARYICLLAFGPTLIPKVLYPQLPGLPGETPRARLELPRDFNGQEQMQLAGRPGAECLLLLARAPSAKPLTMDVSSLRRRLGHVLRKTGAMELPNPGQPLQRSGIAVATTRGFNLHRSGPWSDPLIGFFSEVESHFAGEFADYHFLGIARAAAGKRI